MAQDGPGRLARLRWVALTLCVAAITVNYVDRATVAVANLHIRHDFALSATAIGAVTSVWSLSFALSQLPTGFLVDRVGCRPLLGVALLLWSAAQAAGGFARSFGQLLWIRALLGVGEAPAYPTSTRVTSSWFAPAERGLPSGLYNASSLIGPAVAPPLLTALMLGFGWRMMFVAMGAIGLVVCLLWVLIYRDPKQARLSATEQAALPPQDPAPVTLRQWGRLFRYRTMWGLIIGNAGLGYIVWMYQAWLPAYLEMQQHISIARTGLIGSVPWIFGIAGSLSGGFASDRFAKRFPDVLLGRKLPVLYGLLGLAAFTGLATLASSAVAAVACLCVAIFCMGHAGGAHWALVSLVAPRNGAASCASIQNCGGYLGATLSPVLTGFVVDRTGSFAMALVIAALVALATVVIYHVLIGRPMETEPGSVRAASAGVGARVLRPSGLQGTSTSS